MPNLRQIIIALLTVCSAATGCDVTTYSDRVTKHEGKYLIALETLKRELHNPAYKWTGPTSCEERIPVLHAARALAYWGDPAVPILLEQMDDADIDRSSIYDALAEIGIPMHELDFDSKAVRKWWAENQHKTLKARNKFRYDVGLPPANHGT